MGEVLLVFLSIFILKVAGDCILKSPLFCCKSRGNKTKLVVPPSLFPSLFSSPKTPTEDEELLALLFSALPFGNKAMRALAGVEIRRVRVVWRRGGMVG